MEKNLAYYNNFNKIRADKDHIDLIEVAMNGGKISRETIDQAMQNSTKNSVRISGLQQDTFEYFINNYGQRFKHITLWKCPLINDLTPLECLPDLKYLIIYWNQKASSFWNLSSNRSLVGLSLNDCIRLNDYTPLEQSKTILELKFGDIVCPKLKLKSLVPIGKMIQLKKLNFSAKQIVDNDISPLANLQNLEEITFPLKLFTTEQVVWLKAKLPKNIKSSSLVPFHRFKTTSDKDTIITGKRKPVLSWNYDQVRIQKYSSDFNALVEKYRKEL